MTLLLTFVCCSMLVAGLLWLVWRVLYRNKNKPIQTRYFQIMYFYSVTGGQSYGSVRFTWTKPYLFNYRALVSTIQKVDLLAPDDTFVTGIYEYLTRQDFLDYHTDPGGIPQFDFSTIP